jgi:hypothetical protein
MDNVGGGMFQISTQHQQSQEQSTCFLFGSSPRLLRWRPTTANVALVTK